MFLEKSLGDYSRQNQDYTWNVVQHQRKDLKFSGNERRKRLEFLVTE